ncbi:DUF3574 domain-containing protein [Rhodoligotrophos defluvii]|uniref:DUF3574 domain-containing protein n=1 Tax=Rhodoligotrophos defluvii TaxID=2561934 RepID=UPI0014852184|nr:DUF3574 domain-containing protein [Rhodoligotrophos defluvii]
MHPRIALFLAVMFLGLAASLGQAQQQNSAPSYDAVQSQLFFGLRSKDGTGVSEQAWAKFLAEVITPRFPDGLTVLSAYGQGRAGPPSPALTSAETTKLLVVVHPDTDEARQKLQEIRAEYVRRFNQDSVFHVEVPARIVE